MRFFANSLKFAGFAADSKGDRALLCLWELCCIVKDVAVAFNLPAFEGNLGIHPLLNPRSSGIRVYDPPVSTGGYDVNSGNLSGRLSCPQVQVPAADRVRGAVRALSNGRRPLPVLLGAGDRIPTIAIKRPATLHILPQAQESLSKSNTGLAR